MQKQVKESESTMYTVLTIQIRVQNNSGAVLTHYSETDSLCTDWRHPIVSDAEIGAAVEASSVGEGHLGAVWK